MEENAIKIKSYKFALEMIKFSNMLDNKKQFVISRQILKSGSSIGANVEEANGAITKKEFIMKMQIAYKESRETFFWLKLIRDSDLIENYLTNKLISDSEEIIKLITAILKTAKENQEKK